MDLKDPEEITKEQFVRECKPGRNLRQTCFPQSCYKHVEGYAAETAQFFFFEQWTLETSTEKPGGTT